MFRNGTDLLIYVDGVAVAAAKTCRISMSADMIETASPTNGKYRTFLPGMVEWSVSTTSLIVTVHDKFEIIGNEVRLSFVMRDQFKNLSGDRMTGQALVEKYEVTGAVRSLCTGSFVFRGIGELKRNMLNLRDSEQNNLLDDNGNQMRVVDDNL